MYERGNFNGTLHRPFKFFFNLLLLEKEGNGEGGRERETLIFFSTYLWIRQLILVCALAGDQTCNFGVLVRCSNQLSYPARTQWHLEVTPSKGRGAERQLSSL